MKAEIEELYQKLDIRNIDLKIDSSVNEICKISNQTSTITRAVMYFIIVAFVMCLLIIINTSPQTWALKRKEILDTESDRITYKIDSTRSLIISNSNLSKLFFENDGKYKRDSLSKITNELILNEKKLQNDYLQVTKEKENLVNKFIPEFKYPKFPILGITFDVNDSGITMGFVFVILLLIFFFTKRRENINTKIAFKSITERYKKETNLSIDWKEIDPDLNKNFKIIRELNKENIDITYNHLKSVEKKDEEEATKIINCVIMQKINFCCRKHHYNFLTTNEIFNIPKIFIFSLLNKNESLHPARFLLYLLNCLPFIAYISIVFNDIEIIERVYADYPDLISHLLLVEGGLTVIIGLLCIAINYLSFTLKKVWDNFYDTDFIFNE